MTEDPTRDPQKLLQDREYTYSRAGDILRIVDHVQKVTYDYAYDKLHRLVAEKLSGINAPIVTKVETITLDYTGIGPVHGVKLITLNGVSRTCAYDANGNMVVSPDFTTATNPLNRAITYDADNMPTRIVHANDATVDFVYDGVGKRTKKLVASGKTVLYLGDHFEVENGVNIKYIFGGNLRLAQIKGSLTSYFHKDHLGSTAAVTDEAGLKKESTTYEPFGSTRTQEGAAVSAYKFTDQEADVETNLYNYDARLYDPVLGMFVTPDSVIPKMYDPQSSNRYAYCRNNPLIYTDPSGHVWAIGADISPNNLGYDESEEDSHSTENNEVARGAQGAAIHAGEVLTHDAKVRENYVEKVSSLAPTDSAGRTAAKMEARNNSSPLGKALAETMRPSAQEASRIGGTANKTNAGVNKAMGASKVVGRGLLAVGVAVSVYDVATAPPGQTGKVVSQEIGAWAGALAYGAAGAKLGAGIGTLFGPGPGTAIGAGIGGLAGGIIGGILGAKAGENVYDGCK